ncbi:MAG: ATP-binding protein [Alphaproteobacteria bacterium]|nr:ATP-binding protein [Alphaproteobacteria bacterium]
MSADLDLIVPATTRGLQSALQTLEESCAARRVQADISARARVIIEELFTNTIKYGYGGECERRVRLALNFGSGLTIVLEDEACPFDPAAWHARRDTSKLPSERPAGQAGIALVFGLSSSVDYRPLPAGNRMTIVIEPR